jgi:DNA-directed RNA polymerase subunit RPC12/RpoP
MKECMECGKNLGIIEGYRHPIMGKDYLLCNNCFDTVFESVEKYMEFVSPYIGFFNKETSTIDDIQKIGENIKKMQNKASNIWSHKTNQNANETLARDAI